MDKPFYRVREIAPMLGVTCGRVYQLVNAGELPAVKVGHRVLIPCAAWKTWLAEQNAAAAASVSKKE